MICPKCGTPIQNGATFCSKCGTPVAQQPVQQPVQPAQPAQQPMQTPATPAAPEAPKKSKKGLIIGLSVGGGVLVVLIIVLIIVFSMGGKGDNAGANAPANNNGGTVVTQPDNETPQAPVTSDDMSVVTVKGKQIVIGQSTLKDLLNMGFEADTYHSTTIEAGQHESSITIEGGDDFYFFVGIKNNTSAALADTECTIEYINVSCTQMNNPSPYYDESNKNFTFGCGIESTMTEEEFIAKANNSNITFGQIADHKPLYGEDNEDKTTYSEYDFETNGIKWHIQFTVNPDPEMGSNVFNITIYTTDYYAY